MSKKKKKKKVAKLSVLFVCTGNTCRSPMAEAVLRNLVASGELGHKITVSSAGLLAHDNSPASSMAVEICAAQGVDLTGHRSRQLNEKILASSDIVLGMQPEHLQALAKTGRVTDKELLLLGNFSSTVGEGDYPGIPDPFGGSREEYVQTCRIIKSCMPGLLEYLKTRLGSGKTT